MSTEAQAAGGAAATTTEQGSLLDQVLTATKSTTEKSQAEDMIRSLTEEALKGTVTWTKNLTKTLQDAIIRLDAAMSKQLAAVLRAPELQKLEGTWRGLHHLVMNSETGSGLKLKVMNIAKKDLYKDVSKAVEFDQSQIFKKLYENEFGTPGGEPYGSLIGDYEFANHPDDIELLEKMSNVAAAAFCPFISAAVWVRELGGDDQAARPGENLRRDRLRQVAVVPRQRRLPFHDVGHAARPGPAPVRGEH